MTATESQAAPDLALDSRAFGPQPPDLADLYAAQDAPLRADLSDAEYDRLLAERIQTEIAYDATCDRELARSIDARRTGSRSHRPGSRGRSGGRVGGQLGLRRLPRIHGPRRGRPGAGGRAVTEREPEHRPIRSTSLAGTSSAAPIVPLRRCRCSRRPRAFFGLERNGVPEAGSPSPYAPSPSLSRRPSHDT